MATRSHRPWNPQKWMFFPVVMMAFCGVILFMMSLLMNQQGKLKLTAENPTIRLESLSTVTEFCSEQQIVIGVVLQTLDQDTIAPWINEANHMSMRTYIYGDKSYNYLKSIDLHVSSANEISYNMWKHFYERFFVKPDALEAKPLWFVQVSENSFVRPEKLVDALCNYQFTSAYLYECSNVTILHKDILKEMYNNINSGKCNINNWTGDITQCITVWNHRELNFQDGVIVCGKHVVPSSKDWAIQTNIDFSYMEQLTDDIITCQEVSRTFPQAIYGLSPQKRREFCERPNQSIACGPRVKLPPKKLNDNYCDCPDGSDEYGTNACVNSQVKFWCKDGEKEIFTSFVNDGFPDCSDGSDEYAMSVTQ